MVITGHLDKVKGPSEQKKPPQLVVPSPMSTVDNSQSTGFSLAVHNPYSEFQAKFPNVFSLWKTDDYTFA